MKRGNLIFTIALFLVSILLLRATLAYPFKAKLFPLITLLPVMILLMIQMIREAIALREKGATEGEKGNGYRDSECENANPKEFAHTRTSLGRHSKYAPGPANAQL